MAFFMFLIHYFCGSFLINLIRIFNFYFKCLGFLNLILYFYLGLDGISLFFIILTTFLIPICLLISYESITKNVKEYLYFIFYFRILFNYFF